LVFTFLIKLKWFGTVSFSVLLRHFDYQIITWVLKMVSVYIWRLKHCKKGLTNVLKNTGLTKECWIKINKYYFHICMYSTGVHFSNVCLFNNAVNSVSFECLLKRPSQTQVCQGQPLVCVPITAQLPSVKFIPLPVTSARCLVQMSATAQAIRIEISCIQQFNVRKFHGCPLKQVTITSFHIFSS
jgi:hypothetical protein